MNSEFGFTVHKNASIFLKLSNLFECNIKTNVKICILMYFIIQSDNQELTIFDFSIYLLNYHQDTNKISV